MASKFVTDTILPVLQTKYNPVTVRVYMSCISVFEDYFSKPFYECTHQDAIAYIAHLNEKVGRSEMSRNTVNSCISSLKSVSSIVAELINGYENIFSGITLPSVAKTFSSDNLPLLEDADVLLDVSKQNLRDFLIFAFAIKCGLTTAQICSLQVSQLFYNDEGEVCGLGLFDSNKHLYEIVLPSDVSSIFSEYLLAYAPVDYVFLNSRLKPLSEKTLQRIVQGYVQIAGNRLYDKHINLQKLRHIAIAGMLSSGADRKDVADYTGLSISTLARYKKGISINASAAGEYSVLSIKKRHPE